MGARREEEKEVEELVVWEAGLVGLTLRPACYPRRPAFPRPA